MGVSEITRCFNKLENKKPKRVLLNAIIEGDTQGLGIQGRSHYPTQRPNQSFTQASTTQNTLSGCPVALKEQEPAKTTVGYQALPLLTP